MRFTFGILFILMLMGCDTGNTPAPTFTPMSSIEQPTAIQDDCGLVSASGITLDIAQQRSDAPRTLPNGKPFPGNQPVEKGNQSRRSLNRDGQSEVMIQFTPDSAPNDRNAYIRDIGGATRRQIDKLNIYIVQIKLNSKLSSLPESPIVMSVEFNEIASATQINEPNDPRYTEQWGLPIIGLPQAWESLANEMVTVAVIDSGVCLTHPDLAGRIIDGFDFVDEDDDPTDTFGHGCGVAGVIAATSNNGIGIAGVAPNVNIMPLRVLDSSGIGNYADISAAIIYAVDNGADIINLSLAGTTYSQIMAGAVAYAIDRGVTVVAAAGNQGQNSTFYPAAYPSVINVGSIDPDLNQSSFSNYGDEVDFWAPGRDILTTSMSGDYEFMSGTSFAAPMISGLLALSKTSATELNEADGIAFIYPPNTSSTCS